MEREKNRRYVPLLVCASARSHESLYGCAQVAMAEAPAFLFAKWSAQDVFSV